VAKKSSSGFDFERALKELEDLVARMERGDLRLEESLACFERGVELTRSCQQALREAEQKVQVLLEKGGRTGIVDLERED
jgi:exodeoxyribonuclease VII small subunit